ncbi:hypothetical protein SAMN05192573_104449 [Mucilaginibacter gossypii]|uniref:Uncharacterized protein n=1 Tax=Mucilaginibacter gossypii TaxID=551996 RepID=A0A1G7WJP4_9SPHI|nr:hypothetical protein SAMN05192573_104449 [Mucilaginibacter gossypii]
MRVPRYAYNDLVVSCWLLNIFFDRYYKHERCLRPVLYAHTAQALATRPVSAPITNAPRTPSLKRILYVITIFSGVSLMISRNNTIICNSVVYSFYFFNFKIEKLLSAFSIIFPSIPKPVTSISTRSPGCSHCGS